MTLQLDIIFPNNSFSSMTTDRTLVSMTTHVATRESFSSYKPLLGAGAVEIFQWIVLTFLCQFIDVFGVATNIINIICFIKQGFKEPVNVSLLGLAVSDLGCLTTLIWINVSLTPAFGKLDLPFHPAELQYVASSLPHATFNRITSWITALVTLERCLCVTLPLKVKQIVTSKRVSVIIVSTFIILIFSTAPVYVVNRLDMKFYPDRNRTLLGLVYAEDREIVEKVSFAVNNTCIPFFSFLIIIVCTITLVVKLQSQADWRKQSTNSAQGDIISSRNQKVTKMVVMISTLFIACFVPLSIIFIAMTLEPEISISGRYQDLLIVFGGCGIILESLNSSMNIFIYYKMSSKFRNTFHQIFCLSKNDDKQVLSQ